MIRKVISCTENKNILCGKRYGNIIELLTILQVYFSKKFITKNTISFSNYTLKFVKSFSSFPALKLAPVAQLDIPPRRDGAGYKIE